MLFQYHYKYYNEKIVLLLMTNYRLKMNPRELIDDNIEGLVECIDVKNTTLWEKLIQLGVFTSSVVEYIKVSRNTIFWILSKMLKDHS